MKPKPLLLSVCAIFGLLTLFAIPWSAYSQGADAHRPAPDSTYSDEVSRLVADVRHSTGHFRDFDTIEEAGYGKFLDCFVNYEVGGMGQHYVNGDLAGDDVLDPMRPEALVYEPTDNGDMLLVAFEYLVFADVWEPNGDRSDVPTLFDQEFHLKTNIPDTPPVWTLHLWLWTSNPDGVFADYNPMVFCPDGYAITDMSPQD